MALSKLSDVDIKSLEHHLREWCREKRKKDISLLITGKSGAGKSSLVNALISKPEAEEGREKKPCTHEVTSYSSVIEGVQVRVWDSPGLQDGSDNDKELYMAEIQSKTKGEPVDLVIFCLKMDDTRFRPEDKKTIQILTETFGKELWNIAVIALTFANKVEDPAGGENTGGDKEAFFSNEFKYWREEIHSFLKNEVKIDSKQLQSLPLVPTGYYRKHDGLPRGWLSKFWSACYKVQGVPQLSTCTE